MNRPMHRLLAAEREKVVVAAEACRVREVQVARAEVVAACITYCRNYRTEDLYQHGGDEPHIVLANGLKKLQPAAADLEELLRKERIKELDRFCDNAPEYSQEIVDFIEKRYKQLGAAPYNKEKARAEGKG